MPSNSLALGLYERGISKRTFQHTTGFRHFREEKEGVYREETTFCNSQKGPDGVSRVCGEKVAAS